ncbi:MAG: porphobilinogen synthase [Culicoidibacterales bacterium]
MTQQFTRLKQTNTMRSFFSEYRLDAQDFIYPVFITAGNTCEEIPSMPDVYRYPLNQLDNLIEKLNQAHITSILLFGLPSEKSASGDVALTEKNPVISAIQYLKQNAPHITILADLCLCAYTENGQCCIVENETYQFEKSEELLAQIGLAYAKAGADIIAPSCVFDNHVEKIRTILDNNNFTHTLVVDYAVKFASNYYGPFRDAANSTPTFGDRKAYQLNYTSNEYIRKAKDSIQQQSDAIIIKPGLPYLDIVKELSSILDVPLISYHVSGEYTSLKLMQQQQLLNYEQALIETMISFKRAGAHKIITYAALELGLLCQTFGG